MKTNNLYDIVVVGAGPLGCTAAKTLAENGYNVLLVEKFKLPRYKSCSGQLIGKSIELVETYFGETIPETALCTPTENKGMIFTNDKGKSYRFEQSGLNVWCSSFDYWQVVKAVQFGAEVMESSSVISCKEENESVTLTLKGDCGTYTVKSKYVVNCEGVE